MNIHDEIRELAPNLQKPFKAGDMYYSGNTYPTKERVLIEDSGTVVLVIDSKIGLYFSKILERKGVSYKIRQGIYKAYNATNLKKSGLIDLNSKTQRAETLLQSPEILAEEILAPNKFTEGATKTISVNIYERNPQARKKCIEHYGCNCVVCDFNFGDEFSELGQGFIHVHHLKPLSEIGQEYKLDPIKDLRPVCPNCHAMLHRKKDTLGIDELRKLKTQSTTR